MRHKKVLNPSPSFSSTPSQVVRRGKCIIYMIFFLSSIREMSNENVIHFSNHQHEEEEAIKVNFQLTTVFAALSGSLITLSPALVKPPVSVEGKI